MSGGSQKDYWLKQSPEKPLFADLLWSRPENRRQAGKVLIAGGNALGFAAAADAFQAAETAGIGTVRVIIPDSLQKTVGKVFVAGEYAPSTPSGSFSRKSLAELLALAQWADGVLLAGDFGRNSETAIVLEQFAHKYDGMLTLTKDAADYFIKTPLQLLDREQTMLVLSFAQLQKFASGSGSTTAFTFDMDMLRLIDALHDFTLRHQAHIITKHLDTLFVGVRGTISTIKLKEEMPVWRIHTATTAAVWWLQNPGKPFEALTTSIYSAIELRGGRGGNRTLNP